MHTSPLDFNPFPEKETIMFVDVKRQLFSIKAGASDTAASNNLVAAHALVESIVLQLQPKTYQ